MDDQALRDELAKLQAQLATLQQQVGELAEAVGRDERRREAAVRWWSEEAERLNHGADEREAEAERREQQTGVRADRERSQADEFRRRARRAAACAAAPDKAALRYRQRTGRMDPPGMDAPALASAS